MNNFKIGDKVYFRIWNFPYNTKFFVRCGIIKKYNGDGCWYIQGSSVVTGRPANELFKTVEEARNCFGYFKTNIDRTF